MKKSPKSQLPAKLARGCRRFEQWRDSHKPRSRLPKHLWSLAAELAQEFGLSRTASILRLDYNALKTRVELADSNPHGALPPSPSFLELLPPEMQSPVECTVDCEGSQGTRIHIHIKCGPWPDLADLCSRLWSSAE